MMQPERTALNDVRRPRPQLVAAGRDAGIRPPSPAR
jgi:hypothetical protein